VAKGPYASRRRAPSPPEDGSAGSAARCAGSPIIVELTVRVGYAIFTIATLSFLGVGIQPPSPDWGLMISEEYSQIINGYWWPVVYPSLAIGSLVIAVNLIADALQGVLSR